MYIIQVAEMKKMGVPFDYGAAKLKQGYGDAVIYVLGSLVDLVMQEKKFSFKNTVHKADEYIL
jgi:estrogen-related receptor beta like 1